MAQVLFAAEEAVTTDWLTYIENEARALSQADEFTINSYADRELLNPEVQTYLQDEFTNDEVVQADRFAQAVNFDEVALSEFSLSFEQHKAVTGKAALFGFWKRLKEKIHNIFCLVIGGVVNEGDIDWKEIIKLILLALIPAFASGVPAIALPIVIALVASLMKFGYAKVCPVIA